MFFYNFVRVDFLASIRTCVIKISIVTKILDNSLLFLNSHESFPLEISALLFMNGLENFHGYTFVFS